MIGAGKLDTRCSFENAAQIADGGGGFTTTWTEAFTVSGGFSRIGNVMDRVAAGAVGSSTLARLTVRTGSTTVDLITEANQNAWRIVADNRTWNIRSIRPKDRGVVVMEVESGVAT